MPVVFQIIPDKPIADSVAILKQAADTLKRYPNTEIKIDGYTDSIGSQAYNLKLSERRIEFKVENPGQMGQ
ncbi:protein containing Outer membrane protein, OmpA/MotB [mine drainage metagenome]|uniref:Protein containing Outer membrane protein, OmpA/MotB n=1 Tax=mine drainage metagenome TaxID=410659 RepID=T1BL30_9ZZZZ